MKERETTIEQNFVGDERLVRTEWQHLKPNEPGKLSLATPAFNQ
jgi:hypothetical protein